MNITNTNHKTQIEIRHSKFDTVVRVELTVAESLFNYHAMYTEYLPAEIFL